MLRFWSLSSNFISDLGRLQYEAMKSVIVINCLVGAVMQIVAVRKKSGIDEKTPLSRRTSRR